MNRNSVVIGHSSLIYSRLTGAAACQIAASIDPTPADLIFAGDPGSLVGTHNVGPVPYCPASLSPPLNLPAST